MNLPKTLRIQEGLQEYYAGPSSLLEYYDYDEDYAFFVDQWVDLDYRVDEFYDDCDPFEDEYDPFEKLDHHDQFDYWLE